MHSELELEIIIPVLNTQSQYYSGTQNNSLDQTCKHMYGWTQRHNSHAHTHTHTHTPTRTHTHIHTHSHSHPPRKSLASLERNTLEHSNLAEGGKHMKKNTKLL